MLHVAHSLWVLGFRAENQALLDPRSSILRHSFSLQAPPYNPLPALYSPFFSFKKNQPFPKLSISLERDNTMSKQIPDGEYDLDFSGIFSTFQSDVFGIRYGFRPDTIDKSFPSYFYTDETDIHKESSLGSYSNSSQNDTPLNDCRVPCYLVSETKENTKAITSNINKDDRIYFEGRTKPSIMNNLTSSNSESVLPAGDSSSTSMSEFLLTFDDVTKSFKVDCFNGFIKMNKSREPDIISGKIKKLSQKSHKIPAHTAPVPYIDSLIGMFSKQLSNTSTSRTTNPSTKLTPKIISTTLKRTNTPSKGTISSPTHISRPNIKSSTGKSPIKRSVSNSPINSPTHSAFSSSQRPLSHSPLHSPAASNTNNSSVRSPSPKPSSPLRPQHPIEKTSRSNSSNGGTGIRKQQKSLLLRKAERAVGINNKGKIYKPKLKENTVKDKERDISSTEAVNVKQRESNLLRLKQKKREIKEARPDQAEFELVLTPPPPEVPAKLDIPHNKKKLQPVSKKKEKSSEIEELPNKMDEIKKIKKIDEKKVDQKIITDDDLDNFAEELESEMRVVDEDVIDSAMSEDDQTIKIVPKNSKESSKTQKHDELKETPTAPGTTISIRENVIGDDDGDFNIEFSDWEDADAVEGPLVSDDGELTSGTTDFQLIIEDDPFKNKREREKEREKESEMEKDKPRNNNEQQKKPKTTSMGIELVSTSDSTVKNKLPVKTTKQNKTRNTTKSNKATNGGSKITSKKEKVTAMTAKVASKTVGKSANTKSKKNAKNGRNGKAKDADSSVDQSDVIDDDIDRELDFELDKAFDDLQEEEDMSEEE